MRLFVAISLPEPAQEALLTLPSGLPGADWIDAALAEIAAPGFELTLAGIDFFQTAGRPRVLWAGIDPSSPLLHLARKIDRAVVQAGQPAETRQFTPHVTLARLNSQLPAVMEFVRDNALFRAPSFAVEQFTLFESRQGKGGAAYIPLAEYPLSLAP